MIVARVVLVGTGAALDPLRAEAMDARLAPLGFERVAVVEERHPALGQALYCRRWRPLAEAARAERAQQAKLAAERQAQVEALTKQRDEAAQARDAQMKAKDEQAALVAQRQAELDKLKAERDQQAKLAADRQAQVEALTKQRDEAAQARDAQTKAKDEQVALVAQRQAELDKLKADRDQQAKLAADRQAQVEALTRQRDEAAQARDAQTKAKDEQAALVSQRQAELDKLKADRDQQAKLAADRQVQVEALTKQRDEAAKARDAQTKAKDEQAALVAQRQAELDKLKADRDQQAKLAAERQAQVDALTKQRDEAAQARDAQTKAKDEQAALVAQRQTELDKLKADRDQQAKLAAERQAQVEALTKQRDEAAQARDAQTKAKDEQAALVAQRQAELDKLKAERDQQAKLAADRQAQVEALTKQRDEAAQARDAQTKAKDEQAALVAQRQAELDKLKAERDQQAKLAADRQAQVEALTKQRDEAAQARDEQTKAKDEQAALVAQRQAELDKLKAERDQQAKLAADRQAQVEALTEQRDEAAQARDAQTKAKDEQAALVVQRQAELDKLKAERDQQAKLAADRQAQVETLTKQRDEAAQARDAQTKAKDEQAALVAQRQAELDKLKADRDQQAKLANERQVQLEKLSTERDAAIHSVTQLTERMQEHSTAVARVSEDVRQVAEEQIRAILRVLDEIRSETTGRATEDSRTIHEVLGQLLDRLSVLGAHDDDAESGSFLFEIPLYMKGDSYQLGFDSLRRDVLRVEKGEIAFQSTDDRPIYLVSAPGGSSDNRPFQVVFPLLPGAEYVLSGRIAREGGGRPNIWIYQYDSHEKVGSEYVSVSNDGSFELSFKVLENARYWSIGIRLIGQGRLVAERSHFRVESREDRNWLRDRRLLVAALLRREGLSAAILPNFIALDKAIHQLSSGVSFGELVPIATRCLQEIVGHKDSTKLMVSEFRGAPRALNIMHVEGDYIPTKMLRENRFYEQEFLEQFALFHSNDGVFVDVGANIGNHAIYFAEVIGSRVIAFEPQPHNALCLQINANVNQLLPRIEVHKFALGREVGEIDLAMSIEKNFGSFSSSPTLNPLASYEDDTATHTYYRVPVRTLDAVMQAFHPGDKISVLKVDVEGMEIDVLHGAEDVIRKWLPFIACECFNHATFGRVDAFLTRLGYSAMAMTNATPTFMFYNSSNAFHLAKLAERLRHDALDAASKKKGFNS
ncbi:FkbM family methyltransferase [Piscinibacter sakaiensis]|uniref:FkbM family methyltransferase n=1 Tax=Piscinibacter sakaiensis TaxID=1547922 RepID=UPI003726BEE1